jgi:hypothetical protein
MPNLNEFINNESQDKPGLEKIEEPRPCSRCSKDSTHYYWNPSTFEMIWKCPDGHDNTYRIN